MLYFGGSKELQVLMLLYMSLIYEKLLMKSISCDHSNYISLSTTAVWDILSLLHLLLLSSTYLHTKTKRAGQEGCYFGKNRDGV